MDLPRSCTDIAIALPCSACNGEGGFGHRRPDPGTGGRPSAANFDNCKSCTGTGWSLKRPNELTPAEREKLLKRITPPIA